MVPLRGRLHRFAMETCSARVGPHTVFALAPCASWLKNALGTKRVSHCGSRRSVFWAFLYYAFWRCAALERLGCIGLWLSYCPFLSGPALIWIREIKGRAAFYRLVRRIANACPNAGVPIAAERVAETASIVLRLASLSLFFTSANPSSKRINRTFGSQNCTVLHNTARAFITCREKISIPALSGQGAADNLLVLLENPFLAARTGQFFQSEVFRK